MKTKNPIGERQKRPRFAQSSHSFVLLSLMTAFFFFFLVREASRVWDGVSPDVILWSLAGDGKRGKKDKMILHSLCKSIYFYLYLVNIIVFPFMIDTKFPFKRNL